MTFFLLAEELGSSYRILTILEKAKQRRTTSTHSSNIRSLLY